MLGRVLKSSNGDCIKLQRFFRAINLHDYFSGETLHAVKRDCIKKPMSHARTPVNIHYTIIKIKTHAVFVQFIMFVLVENIFVKTESVGSALG